MRFVVRTDAVMLQVKEKVNKLVIPVYVVDDDETRYRVFMAVQVDAGRAPDMLTMLAATGTGKFAASRQKENKFLALLAAH